MIRIYFIGITVDTNNIYNHVPNQSLCVYKRIFNVKTYEEIKEETVVRQILNIILYFISQAKFDWVFESYYLIDRYSRRMLDTVLLSWEFRTRFLISLTAFFILHEVVPKCRTQLLILFILFCIQLKYILLKGLYAIGIYLLRFWRRTLYTAFSLILCIDFSLLIIKVSTVHVASPCDRKTREKTRKCAARLVHKSKD